MMNGTRTFASPILDTWALVWIPHRTKKPIHEGWSTEPRPDYATMDSWLADAIAGRCNVGLRTGAISGAVVVDFDVAKGAQLVPMPATITAETPGGWHFYYALPTGVRIGCSVGSLAPFVDVRGDGGQAVLPPSTHPTGNRYKWKRGHAPGETELAPLPAWIVEKLSKPADAYPKGTARTLAGNVSAWAQAALRGNIERVETAPSGTRNDTLNKAGFRLGQLYAGGELPDTRGDLFEAARACGLVADDGEEATRATIESGWNAGTRYPANRPESSNGRNGTHATTKTAASAAPEREPGEDAIDAGESSFELESPGEWVEPRELPEIQVVGGQLPAIVDQAEAALLDDARTDRVFQRGGVLVRIARIESGAERRGIKRDPGALTVQLVSQEWLQERLTKAARFSKWNAKEKKLTPIDCPAPVAKALLARVGGWRAPVLRGIIEAPTLREDGSILQEPGFDEASGLYFDPGPVRFPRIPEHVTKEDAERELRFLKTMFEEFPYAKDENDEEQGDRSVALSAVLTALVRKSLESAPLHAFSAPKMRSGKSLQADCVSLMVTGRRAAVLTQCERAEDERKRLLAVLLEGDPIVLFDNVERAFGTDAIAQVLTQPVFKDRLLSFNKTASAPTSAMFLATGNNLAFVGDTSARCLRCDIDPMEERPEERKFKRNLLAWVPENRARLVTAGLIILRAYHLAGRPKQDLPAWGGFEEWSDWVRSALVWLGELDPCLTRKRIEETDPVRIAIGGLLEAWFAVFGSEPTITADVARRIEKQERTAEEEQLREAVFEAIGGEKFNANRFGKYLAGCQKRIERGKRLKKLKEVSGVRQWSVTEHRPK